MNRKVLIATLLIAQTAAGQDIQVRELDNGQLEFQLSSSTILEIAMAQRLLQPRIIEACGDVRPVLGRYRFASREPTDADALGNRETTYQFVQEVSCGPVEASSGGETETGILRTDLVQGTEDFIRSISLRFLNDRSEGDFATAHAALSSEMKSYSTFEEWTRGAQAFNERSGPILAATVWRVTVYNNPPGAPEPGVYIAADYEAEYENVPFQCGYLMWFERPERLYVMTREESGSIPREIFERSSAAELAAIKEQLRCMR